MPYRLDGLRPVLLLATLPFVAACEPPASGPAADPEPALKDVFEGAFLIGAALNPEQFYERDSLGAALVKKHFNTITPENVMKWELIHPEPDRYDFEAADRFVAFGEENGMFIVGHTLVWHNQTPRWVFEDSTGAPVSREVLRARLRDHIHTVVGRYRGRVHGWDVVNEALNEDGTLRATPWLRILGEEYLAMAFRFAHEADPDAELYYNDYGLENPAKRDGAVRLARRLMEQGVPITGIGTQGHHHLAPDVPTPEAQAATLRAFGDLGLDVMVTELDLAVLPRPRQYWGADITQRAELRNELNPYPDALPDSVQQALARRYAALFRVFLEHRDVLERVTFWGVTDGDSWLNNWPIAGRTTYPLLFDRHYRPKPAFHAVVHVADSMLSARP
ncbi:endo-1,4-beta-xylanase [Rhodocaloribacter litoris]|uniref:endo-1,4-beta-xylanase n=1 Tax=Rhodocaloribacter litoris TaxID=2558931 RepID=UPI00142317DB|nr:endo-1,4-beta-xylanase [Rhodocaloribacter litoris]QXD14811.1 endo-1,4-beta-xylanase [Rhodocaloribacter litoris]